MPPTKPEDAKEKIVDAMMKNWEKHRWIHIRAVLDLHTDEAANRLTAFLTVHLLLDRALTDLLSLRLLDPRTEEGLEDVAEAVSRVSFKMRVDLAKAARLISDSCAINIKAVNVVRNKLAHCPPWDSGGGLGLAPALSSMTNFEECMLKGENALNELIKNIREA